MNSKPSGKVKKDLLAFGRSDYLATNIVLGIAVVGSVVFGLGGPAVGAVTNAPLGVAYRTDLTGDVAMPRGATVDGDVTVDLLLADPTLGERLVQALPGLLIAGLTISLAWMLFRLARSTQSGEPFSRRNVRRINTIALVIGVGGTLAQVVSGVADSAILTGGRLPNEGEDFLIFSMTFSPLPFVVMLVIALIGEAFRRGVELRDDVEGLVWVPVEEPHRVVCHLTDLLTARGMTLTALSDAVGVSLVNLSVMKNNRAKAIRYTTLTAICDVLACQPADLFSVDRPLSHARQPPQP